MEDKKTDKIEYKEYVMFFEAFEKVRKEFFPRWRKNGEWGSQPLDDRDRLGTCVDEKWEGEFRGLSQKFIGVEREAIQEGDPDKIDAMIIHEICHAVLGIEKDHGVAWLNRMSYALRKAKKHGRERLCTLLFEDIHRWVREYASKKELENGTEARDHDQS